MVMFSSRRLRLLSNQDSIYLLSVPTGVESPVFSVSSAAYGLFTVHPHPPLSKVRRLTLDRWQCQETIRDILYPPTTVLESRNVTRPDNLPSQPSRHDRQRNHRRQPPKHPRTSRSRHPRRPRRRLGRRTRMARRPLRRRQTTYRNGKIILPCSQIRHSR